MKQRVILLSIIASALVGSASALVITSLDREAPSSKNFTLDKVENQADAYFAGNPSTQNILPDFTMAAEKGVKSVVNINVIKRVAVRGGRASEMDMFEYFFGNPSNGQRQQQQMPQYQEQKGGGSGVIISQDGYIVSNNHVIEGADEVKVTTSAGDTYTAKVVGTDPATDIALLKIEANELPFLEFGSSDNLRLGEWVLAIGNPYGLTSTVTQGIISAKGRSVGATQNSRLEIESFIQTDAVVNPGNSGGALITLDGNLIGINTMLYSQTGSYAGYSFAVPSSIARKIVADIREFGAAQRAMIGIQMGEITAEWVEKFGKELGVTERGGIYVGKVVQGGAAEASGVKEGDILVAINDQPINTAAEVQETIARHRPNDKVKLSIKRDGQVKQIDVILRNRDGNTDIVKKQSFDLAGALGAEFREITDNQKKELKIRYGIQVTSLNPQGILARSRVKAGFIITAINDTPITKVSQIETMNINGIETIEGIYPDGTRATYAAIAK